MKKVLLTGGHAVTTAISVIEELIRRYGKEGIDISWIGVRFPVEGKKINGIELKVFPEIKIKSYLIKLPVGFIRAVYFILKIKPDITLSFGGFAAFPVVFASALFGIPVLIHEQTASLGFANKLSSIFAKEILLAKEVGNPVMTQICDVQPKTVLGNPPVIFVMGGSRGSERINDAVFSVLPKLLDKYRVIHLTGESDCERFEGMGSKKNYRCFSFVSPLQIDNLYRESDIVVSRSGANTVAELMVVKRPAILIPIPWSHLNEQGENAKLAQKFGLARILKQEDLSGERLLFEIDSLIKDWSIIVSNIKSKHSGDLSASSKVVDVLTKYLK
ncbi:MAG: UDP-N-acetylglucosamine--N-acetylmuramyl-(pentapeptide) pyrophosphoryl-undecaprenol N-acetylglucosamine transferase [Patescibacteria group bacterium]